MPDFSFEKVLVLPETLTPNTLYFTPGPTTDTAFVHVAYIPSSPPSSPITLRTFKVPPEVDEAAIRALVDDIVGSLQVIIYPWGNNTYGQAGNNTLTPNIKAGEVPTIGKRWKKTAAGFYHNLGTKRDGSIWSWGYNNNSQLGLGDTVNRSSPIQITTSEVPWSQITAGDGTSAGVRADGTLWVWGINNVGQLARSDTGAVHSTPIQTDAAGASWSYVSLGAMHIAALKTNGTIWTSGSNAYGQLGDRSSTTRTGFVEVVNDIWFWSDKTPYRALASGHDHVAAIKTNNTLWLWGRNTYGQLGDNTTTNRSSPIQITGGGNTWSQVTSGGSHTAAIKTDGSLWLWGQNTYGQLGTNNTIHYSSPVQTVSGGSNWRRINIGLQHTLAIKTNGSLWTWGRNDDGQLGINSYTHKSSPTQASSANSWIDVRAGYQHSLGIFQET